MEALLWVMQQCEIEIIKGRYRNTVLIRKLYEAQIDLVKIQRKRRKHKHNSDDDQRNKDEEDSIREYIPQMELNQKSSVNNKCDIPYNYFIDTIDNIELQHVKKLLSKT